jgi:hypothetical protein
MSGPVRGDSAVIQHLITLPFPSAATGLTYFCESSRVRRHTEIHTHTHTHTHTLRLHLTPQAKSCNSDNDSVNIGPQWGRCTWSGDF